MALRSKSEVIAWGMTPMHLRTWSAYLATSNPRIFATPEDGGSSVVSTRISVDFPAPFGTEQTEDFAVIHVETDIVDRAKVAKALAQMLHFDRSDGLWLSWRCSHDDSSVPRRVSVGASTKAK